MEQPKYHDYGNAVPVIYGEGQKLMNLLEFFRSTPDKNVDIDNYINYCMMFYDYTDIFKSDFFKEHADIACNLARHVLVSVLKGDQNYHYENVAFICDMDEQIDFEFISKLIAAEIKKSIDLIAGMLS